jgi:hypothetical protein
MAAARRDSNIAIMPDDLPHPNAVDTTLMTVIIACFHRELTGHRM